MRLSASVLFTWFLERLVRGSAAEASILTSWRGCICCGRRLFKGSQLRCGLNVVDGGKADALYCPDFDPVPTRCSLWRELTLLVSWVSLLSVFTLACLLKLIIVLRCRVASSRESVKVYRVWYKCKIRLVHDTVGTSLFGNTGTKTR